MLVSQRVYRVNLYIFSSPSSETMKLLSSHTFYHRSKASHNSRFPSSHSFEQLKTPHKCHWSTEKTSERSGIWNIISGIQVCPPRLRRITCSLFSTPPVARPTSPAVQQHHRCPDCETSRLFHRETSGRAHLESSGTVGCPALEHQEVVPEWRRPRRPPARCCQLPRPRRLGDKSGWAVTRVGTCQMNSGCD